MSTALHCKDMMTYFINFFLNPSVLAFPMMFHKPLYFHNHAQNVLRCGTKARLSFSGGPLPPVNMADSMENAGSLTVSGSKEAMEVLKDVKDL